MNRKKLIILAIIILAISLGLFLSTEKRDRERVTSTQQAAQLSTQDQQPLATSAETAATENNVSTPHTPTAQPVTEEPAPIPDPPVTPASLYGEDSATPGCFTVFDKESVMAAAGISSNDYQYVSAIMGYCYMKAGVPSITLFNASPASRMSSAGEDWQTNPITQTKWANGWARDRYGGWPGAYTYWQANHIF